MELDEWVRDPHHLAGLLATERLRAAFEVIDVFAGANRASSAAAWLCEPGGGARPAPARLIRTAGPEAIKRVIVAASRFVSRPRFGVARLSPAVG